MGWVGRGEGGSGWGTHERPWLTHVNVWQKPPQYCKVISLQLKLRKKDEKKKENEVISVGPNPVIDDRIKGEIWRHIYGKNEHRDSHLCTEKRGLA